jgi:formate hydrogenlyase subunit 3/multisubunit Na+/H+ antiporter MnhD subunit
MIVTLTLFSLLTAAAACLALSALVPTRGLSWGAALVCAVGALLVGLTPIAPAPPVVLLDLGDATFSLAPQLMGIERGLAVALLGGGSAAFLALASALAASVRGFGPIVGWALIALSAALLSLAAPATSLVHPLSWAIAALASYAAIRASGVLAQSETPPYGVVLGLLATVLLLGALTRISPALALGEQPPTPAAAGALLAVIALIGAAPLGLARSESLAAPAPLGALINALVLPVLGLGWLMRLLAELPFFPLSWLVTVSVVGAATALAAAAGMFAVQGLRALLGNLTAFQIGLALVATGLADPIASLGGLALLLNLMLAGVIGAVAAAALERSSGSDQYTANGPRLPGVGALWALGAVIALGLPPFWGAWGRIWLFESTLVIAPWLTPVLLAAGVLAIPGALLPLVRFWGPAQAPTAVALGPADWIAGLVPGSVALALGFAPQVAWMAWLSMFPFAPVMAPINPGVQLVVVSSGGLLALVVGLLARAPSGRSLTTSVETPAVRLASDALGASLAPLAALGRPQTLYGLLWRGLDWISRGLRIVMLAFEQRYYLLGVLMALIVVMLLMAQL